MLLKDGIVDQGNPLSRGHRRVAKEEAPIDLRAARRMPQSVHARYPPMPRTMLTRDQEVEEDPNMVPLVLTADRQPPEGEMGHKAPEEDTLREDDPKPLVPLRQVTAALHACRRRKRLSE